MRLKHMAAAAALAATLAPAAALAQPVIEGVAAIVNDQVISTYDVRTRANLLLVSAGIESTPEMMERARTQALRDLIDERLQMQEARQYEIQIASSQIDARLADIARGTGASVEELSEALARGGSNVASLRSQIEADIAWSRLMGGLYGTRVRVSDNEITDTLARVAANATREQLLVSEIFLPATTEQEFAEMQAGATRLIQEMQRGAPFPLVARQFSQSASAAAGGDVGWLALSELPPELQPIAERLQPGQVSLPVRTPNGVYIVAVRDRRAGAAAGSTSFVSLRQITAPAARSDALGRARISGCDNLESAMSGVSGASVVDLGQTSEADLSPAIRERINGVAVGAASAVQVSGDQASIIVVCAREAGGAGLPSRQDIEASLREREITLLSERYLRNLRREATIITRQPQ